MGRGALSYYKPTPLSGSFTVKTVHREEHGVCADVGQNANKFYRAYLEESVSGAWRCRTHYGRVGYDGKQESRGGPDRASAEGALQAVLSEKFGGHLGSGKYDPVEIIKADPDANAVTKDHNGRSIVVAAGTRQIAAAAGTVKGGKGVRAPLSWAPEAQRFYNPLLDEATVLVATGMQASSITAAGFETPLGLIGPTQLTRGIDYLAQLDQAIAKNDAWQVDHLNGLYFRTIPTASGMKLDAQVMRSRDRVATARALLEDAQGLIAAQQTAAPTDGQKEPVYPVTLEIASDAEIAALTDLLRAQTCRCHPEIARLTPKAAFRVTRPDEKERFKATVKRMGKDTIRQLFHGTRRTSAAGILSRGLLTTKAAVASGGSYAGSAYGDGIYAADNAGKSLGYTGGAPSGKRILFVLLGAMGRAQVVTGRSSWSFRQDPAYDSVWAKGGADLAHDEMIFKSPDQIAQAFVMEV